MLTQHKSPPVWEQTRLGGAIDRLTVEVEAARAAGMYRDVDTITRALNLLVSLCADHAERMTRERGAA